MDIAILVDCPELDGIVPWMHRLLYKGFSTSQHEFDSYEDYFQEFMLLWLKRRVKYSPERGKVTTFATFVIRSFIINQTKNARRLKKIRFSESPLADVAYYGNSDYTEVEDTLLTAFVELANEPETKQYKRTAGKRKATVLLCEKLGWTEKQLNQTGKQIQEKLRERRRYSKRIVALEYAESQ